MRDPRKLGLSVNVHDKCHVFIHHKCPPSGSPLILGVGTESEEKPSIENLRPKVPYRLRGNRLEISTEPKSNSLAGIFQKMYGPDFEPVL